VQSLDYLAANRAAFLLLVISFVVLSVVYGINRRAGRRAWLAWAAN
jgi:ABC-type sulfate transport system permease component